jgi:bifunctional non-homologous end joining protein LigD
MLQSIFERSRLTHLLITSVLADGRALLADVARRGGEGIVAKRCSSLYAAGQRTRDWLKIKCVRRDDFVIVGWHAAPDNTLSSIIVASQDGDGLRFRGSVGSGFSREERTRLPTMLQKFEVRFSPCFSARPVRSHVRWIKPVLFAELRYDAITGGGVLRGAAFLGMRDDLFRG